MTLIQEAQFIPLPHLSRTQVVPGLFIGSAWAEMNEPALTRAGITDILQVRHQQLPRWPPTFVLSGRRPPRSARLARQVPAQLHTVLYCIDLYVNRRYPMQVAQGLFPRHPMLFTYMILQVSWGVWGCWQLG